jgi:hypothetical protein
MKNNLINILLFIILISRVKTLKSESEGSKISESKFGHDKILTQAAIDLYLPKYDFQRPHKIKESYSKISKYLNDEKKKNENLKDLYIVPEEDIIEDDEGYKKRVVSELIKKEVNMDETKFGVDYEYYLYPGVEVPSDDYRFVPNGAEIIPYFEVEDGIEFHPPRIELNDK